MRDNRCLVGTAVLALGAASGAGHAQESDVPAVTLEEMAQRLVDLESQNQTLQGRVNELESAEGDSWLSEQRAAEIRGIVTDVLSDANTRTSLQSSGITAGWDDGFFLQSPDGRFRLNVGGMVQARYQYSHFRKPFESSGGQAEPPELAAEDNAIRRYGWDLPHTRLDFGGHVFGTDTTFRLMGEFANMRSQSFTLNAGSTPFVASGEYGTTNGQLQVLDAWVAHSFTSSLTVRVGQFKLPFDRGWGVDIPNQLTGDRTALALHMGLGRSQGLELQYSGDDFRGSFAVSEGATDRIFEQYRLAGTDPMNSPYYDTQSEFSFSGRMEWKLAGAWQDFDRMTSPPGEEFGLMLGFGAHYQKNKLNINPTGNNGTPGNKYNSWLGLTGDVTANFGGATLTASAYYQNIDSGASYLIFDFSPVGFGNPSIDVGTVDIMGASIFGSMYVTSDIELYAGVEWMAIVGDNKLTSLSNASNQFYGAYIDPADYIGLDFGATYYIDGEDLKIGASLTYLPREVSPNWNTPQLGIRSSPVGDQFILRGYVQLLF
ncbi:MAG: hypothetical protein GY895_07020 [Phycisphaera sp.]|nr:hypothetical protein [Phycisphaera sp.]